MVRKTKKLSVARRIWNIICWPFQKIWAGIVYLYKWISGVNMVALLNLALLVSIIVLFSLLIMDLRKGANASNSDIIISQDKPIILKPVNNSSTQAKPTIKPRPKKITSLPVKRQVATRKPIATPIQVAQVKENPVAINQVARQAKSAYGDIIVDHYDMRNVLQNGAHIHGDLYIQDLRKYTLPCNIVIDGNLILRDVNMVNFCGDFTVRGNIYVNPRSSFGPVPSTARIGGQVIL